MAMLLPPPPSRLPEPLRRPTVRVSPRAPLRVSHSKRRARSSLDNGSEPVPNPNSLADDDVKDLGVKAALSLLKFYKREISPLLPISCRYVPTCSEYSMAAYKTYGVIKGTALTAWRLCRCNPLGGSGFDPPRWFGEERPSEHS